MDEGLRIFLQESHENLERFERDVLVLESAGAAPELVRGIFRAVHTMKGMCGYLGLRRLEAITHAGEELLAGLREGKIAVGAAAPRPRPPRSPRSRPRRAPRCRACAST